MIIDADPAARAWQAAALRDGGVWVAAEAASGEEALRLVRAMVPDVVVIDAALPGMGAAATVRRLRELAPGELSVVAVADDASIDRLSEVVPVGVSAFVAKGKSEDLLNAVELASTGKGVLSPEVGRKLLEDVIHLFEQQRNRANSLEQTVSDLRATSVTDWLTGLKNHGYFFDRLTAELERARRYDRSVSVAVVDIDDFKTVNDTFGHSMGDAVLRRVGEILRSQIRETDLACRIGGEEFGVLMPETGTVGAAQAAERIRQAIASVEMPGVGTVHVSIGVAVFPDQAGSRDQLFEAADRALYRAKRDGKNQVRVVGDYPAVGSGDTRPVGPVVGALIGALRMRAPDLVDQSIRVAELSVAIGTIMGMKAAELADLHQAGLLHDVGMLSVPDSVLLKQGTLTNEEWGLVRSHPHAGHDLVAAAVHETVAEAVLSHHECFDGSGYPRGLRGDGIPVLARVVKVADAFVAGTSKRAYRVGRSPTVVEGEILAEAGILFDAVVAEALRTVLHPGGGEVIHLPVAAG